MKILLFADKLPPNIGGMETHAKYFIKHFSKENELIIISNRNGCDVIVNNEFQTVEKIDLLNFLKSFENTDCIVFYNSGYWIECFSKIKSVLKKACFLYRTGGNEINKAPLSLDIASHTERQNYWVSTINRNIDFLIANSQFTKLRLIELGIKSSIIRIISGGVDLSNIQEAVNKISKTRTLLNISTETLIVCCCRFVPYKRTDFLLRSFQYLPQKYKIVLVGDGDLLDDAKVLAKRLNLNVRFLGRLTQEETLNIIAAANVYCQASTDLLVEVRGGKYIHTEGMGRSLIEAICSGTRVVVTNCGAVGEFINSENGVVSEDSEVEFAKQIEKVIALPPLKETSRQSYLKEYSFEKIFSQYENLWS
ncbi:glycosyltransferase family 4 protein [Capnocytophaga stomatis]|uniref:glycosyltransferase family 4 protein n=1 Tax=Capnocytophaga stomatis TaxID=1848904 RepID=UPI001BB42551|nr:glycosyltransferase family 4 protein [Capnocytophaga stomatis]